MINWMTSGPDDDVVVSTRVRLARNFNGIFFPHMLGSEKCNEIIDDVFNWLADKGDFKFIRMKDTPILQRMSLVESHIASPDLAKNEDAAIAVSADERLSVMVNEEDHLRIQCLLPGIQFDRAYEMVKEFEEMLAGVKNGFSYNRALGFLTSCPTNVGTGMRASIMLHMPGQEMTGMLNDMIHTVQKVGLTVRGIYGEGSDAIGSMYQLSNQITLGVSRLEIIKNLLGAAPPLIEAERRTRESIKDNSLAKVEDRVFRAYGLLKYARSVTSRELSELISDIKLGVSLNIIRGIANATLHRLLIETKPSMLQIRFGRSMDDGERDYYRAEIARDVIEKAESNPSAVEGR